MSNVAASTSPDIDSAVRRPLRAPAAPVFAIAAAGICCDRWQGVPLAVWIGLMALGALIGLWPDQRRIVLICGVGLGWGALAGAWHHVWWAEPAAGQIFHWSTDEGQVVTLEGSVVQPGWLRQRAGRDPEWIWIVRCEGIWPGSDQFQHVGGQLRVQCADPALTTRRDPFRAGDRLRLTGRLIRPAVAGNPGGFDYRNWLKTQGIQAVLRIQHAAAIEQQPHQTSLTSELANWRHRLRRAATDRLQATADPVAANIGEALLLGSRSQMPDDIRQAFIDSGMLHMLAISGVNVAVIWWGLIRLCRTIGFTLRSSSYLVIAGLISYAWLTDANPPIVRAVTFAIVFQCAELLGRRISGLQGMSLAALVILAQNPTDLFNPGAWLSFLSVAVLASVNRWCNRPMQHWREHWQLDDAYAGPLRRGLYHLAHWGGEAVFRITLTTLAIWVCSAPLVAYSFHFLSFAGIVLNILIAPLFAGLLWLGYLWLLLVVAVPPVSDLLLWPLEGLLQGLVWASRWGSSWTRWHAYVAGPPEWWVIGFYVGVGLWLASPPWWSWSRQWKSALVWLNVGLLWALLPTGSQGVICDVVSVGHGLAIVVQGPAGKTLLYDAGSLAGDEIAAEGISLHLWQARKSRIDAAVVSHADADHCNAIPLLAERFSVGTLLFHPTFAAHPGVTVAQVRQAWQSAGGHEQEISAGDRLDWDPQVEVDVWQPDHDTQYERDNANSLIICLKYAGRSLLLTGDLEREGLNALLQRTRTPVDVLIAPHHGSLGANTSEFAAWTNPDWVVISASQHEIADRLRERYAPEARLLNTATQGRVRIHIWPDGRLDVQSYR